VRIASPTAASAAAITKTNNENICPVRSFKLYEKPTKFILTASNISSIDIKIVIIFFLLINIPRRPIEKIIEDNKR
tara:strand:+ start:887 stop:1114 length:228 start_codon:yes stop_codon:yes gene_type:complete